MITKRGLEVTTVLIEAVLIFVVVNNAYAIVNNNPSMPGCPIILTIDNFTLERFSGVWYEIQKLSSQFEIGSCVSIDAGSYGQSMASIKFSQKIGNNFTDFYQNATVLNKSSVWSFNYNRSISGEFHLTAMN